jgi:hypothetical protein
MDAAIFSNESSSQALLADMPVEKLVSAAEFRLLLVSHRHMVRVDRREERLRGLHDLETGEVFLTDERRLVEAGR